MSTDLWGFESSSPFNRHLDLPLATEAALKAKKISTFKVPTAYEDRWRRGCPSYYTPFQIDGDPKFVNHPTVSL